MILTHDTEETIDGVLTLDVLERLVESLRMHVPGHAGVRIEVLDSGRNDFSTRVTARWTEDTEVPR